MDEKDWLILKHLHEKLNITKTAAAVYISQPALSKRLRLIEERFGASIALRNKNGIELTPAGEYLARCSAEILEKMREIEEYLHNLDSEVRGTLRLGASHFCTKYALPDILMRFKERYPLVEFQLTSAWSSDIAAQVVKGDLHVGFIRNESPLLEEKYLLFKERTYICSRKPLDLAMLPFEPQICHRTDILVKAKLDIWWSEHYSSPPRIAMVVDRVNSSADMVERGLGYAFLSEFSANQLQGIHRYEITHANGEPYYRYTWIVPNQDAKQLKIVARFIEFVAGFTFPGDLGVLYKHGTQK